MAYIGYSNYNLVILLAHAANSNCLHRYMYVSTDHPQLHVQLYYSLYMMTSSSNST